jgi:VIT1/CCC1 family predicted Fe2+/Mn2+ transporter
MLMAMTFPADHENSAAAAESPATASQDSAGQDPVSQHSVSQHSVSQDGAKRAGSMRRLHHGRDRPRPGEAHGHQHRDVSGGWLRPAVFGSMDGLVTNVSLIAGVGGGRVGAHTIVLTGMAGLAAGAFSMATGEYVSVSSQNELVQAEVTKERYELEHNPDAEARELAAVFRHRGVDAELADQVARQVGRKPEEALRMHVREELGVDHHDLPSPYVAAGASLVTFAVGALIPLLPYLLGFHSLAAALALAAVAAFFGGGTVARITDRPFLRGAVRQLLLAGAAAGLTYLIGMAVHASIS